MKNLSKYMLGAGLLCLTLGGIATAETINKQNWGDFKLWIDPGHSGHENTGLYGYSEAQKVLRVGLATRDFLMTYTTADTSLIHMTRDDDNDNVSLEERSDMANAWGADFFYSIHSDAGAPSENSTVTLFGGWKLNGEYIEKTPHGGKAMGDILCPNLTSVMYNTTTRGNYYDRVFYNGDIDTHENQYPYLSVNRRTNMASILSEGGYHTLPMQQSLNMNDSYKHLEAFGTFRSIMQYRGLTRPDKVMLAGVVKNSENDQPINGVQVTVDGKTIVTDTYESLFSQYVKNPDLVHNGFFLYEDLTPGKQYTVNYHVAGYPDTTLTVTMKSDPQGLSGDNVTWANIYLTSSAPAIVASNSIVNPEEVNTLKGMTITFSRKMDRASVEKAFTIDNGGKVTLSWTNDYTLNVDLNQLGDYMKYTIKIDGSIAKNSQTNQFLDGDNDGKEGGDYTFTFTTIEADTEAPYVASTTPEENSTMLYTLRPVIRIEYNEELEWNEDDATDAVVVEDKDGNKLNGTLKVEVVRDATVLHYYLDNDLTRDACYKVTVKGGFKDLSGNVSEGKVFKFLSEYRTYTPGKQSSYDKNGTIDPINNVNDWFSPGGSGTSAGFTTMEDQTMVTSDFTSNSSIATSFHIHFKFDPNTTDAYWGLRCYKRNGAKYFSDGKNAVIQAYAHGDGSGVYLGHYVRSRADGASVKRWNPNQSHRGWEIYAWDLSKDSAQIVTGTTGWVKDALWMYDAFSLWKGYKSEFADEDPDDPDIQWEGDIYFDDLKYGFYGNETQTASLDDIDINTNIDDVKAASVTIRQQGGNVKVVAPDKIQAIAVYAMNGQQVLTSAPAATQASLNVSGLSAGAYVVRVVTAAKTAAQRIVVK